MVIIILVIQFATGDSEALVKEWCTDFWRTGRVNHVYAEPAEVQVRCARYEPKDTRNMFDALCPRGLYLNEKGECQWQNSNSHLPASSEPGQR